MKEDSDEEGNASEKEDEDDSEEDIPAFVNKKNKKLKKKQ